MLDQEAFFSVPNCLECNGLENAENQRAGSVEKLVTHIPTPSVKDEPQPHRRPLFRICNENLTPAMKKLKEN